MKNVIFTILMVCLCLCMTCVFVGCAGAPQVSDPSEIPTFRLPTAYTSVVQVSINPTVNLYLNEENVILAVEYVNQDAKDSYARIETELIGADLTAGVNRIVETAASDGYFTENKEVTIQVLDNKPQTVPEQLLQSANNAAKEALESLEIEATIQLVVKGETVSETELNGTPAGTQLPSSTPTSVPTPTPVTPKAPDIQLNSKYVIYKKQADEMVVGYAITFKADGEYSYTEKPYSTEDYGVGEPIVLDGVTYYESGGAGGGGTYTITGDDVVLTGGLELQLCVNEEGHLVVQTSGESFFVSGDIIEK